MPSQLDLNELAKEIDAACDAQSPAELDKLLKKCGNYLLSAEGAGRVDLHYFMANIYSGLWRIKAGAEGPCDWDQHGIIQEILSLRRAINEPEFERCDSIRRCQIRTNLANSLSTVGRLIEAIEEYSCVLQVLPDFAMALGNRAYAITTFSAYLYDSGHQCLLLDQSRRDYQGALRPKAIWDSGFITKVAAQFKRKLSDIDQYLDAAQFDYNFDLSKFSLGKSAGEVKYRRWCLANCLFINPLNDITKESVAAKDVLHLPSHSYELDEEVRFPAFYNILKQEYVSARFHLFQSQPKDEEHLADRDVFLLDSDDYGVFDFRAEQLKLAFRSTYSIFDKIGNYSPPCQMSDVLNQYGYGTW